MKQIFRSIRKPMWPIFLPLGILILWSFLWYSTICMWRAEIYYKTSFTEQEQKLLRREFNILPQSDIIFVSGELRMDIRSMQDVTVRISGDDAYEIYLMRENIKGATWYTLMNEAEPYVVEIRRERFSDWETAHAFRDNPDVFDENRILKQNLGLGWDQKGEEIFTFLLVVLIVAFVSDFIRSSNRRSRRIVNRILRKAGSHFRLQEIQYVDGIGILRLNENGGISLEGYIETIDAFQTYMTKCDDSEEIRVRIRFWGKGTKETLEITNYKKEYGELYENLNCLYIPSGTGKNLLDILERFSDLRYLYVDRNLSVEERICMAKKHPDCEIG